MAQTSEITAFFPENVTVENLRIKHKFIRTFFGVLNAKERRGKKGFALTVDLSAADRYTREGAMFMAEMIGIQAVMVNGNGPSYISIGGDGREGIDKVKTYNFNQSMLDNNRGSELMMAIAKAFNTSQDLLMYRPGDIVSKEGVIKTKRKSLITVKYIHTTKIGFLS